MKSAFHLSAALLILPLLLLAEPKLNTDISKISEPPREAPVGKLHKGVEIGLWTENRIYGGTKIRNVWMHARKDKDSTITFGVGGSRYKNSFLHITSNGKEIDKIPLSGPLDGMVDPTSSAAGLSGFLAKLPSGTYQLIWKTDTHWSNAITVEIRNGEQGGADQPTPAPDSKPEGKAKPKPEAEGRSQ
ncbi:MAG: hypothetical protein CFE26_10385 [Verrucomicrobiales bacterium VVV1]|nr:MAG: hypothetical protein CFE26_10385 [Verrucomicrobiales bacterium VVV1]